MFNLLGQSCLTLAAILSQWFVAINADCLASAGERLALFKAQADHAVVIVFRAAAAVAVAGQEI
jgi:hypothetical protein